MRQHDKIINMAAKKVLNPHGLFRKGTSRTWLDDNGYFMIFVVFDASNWSQGSYLGVGIDFLWEKWEGLHRRKRPVHKRTLPTRFRILCSTRKGTGIFTGTGGKNPLHRSAA